MKNREIHKLFAESGNKCNFSGCNNKLFYEYENGTFIKLVEICHIIAQSPNGPRGDASNSHVKKQDPNNLILLCRNCHRIIDGNPDEFNVKRLLEMKRNHIEWVNKQLNILKELNWTLILHVGNITNKGMTKIDEELIFKEFLGIFTLANVEKLEVPEFLVDTKNWIQYKEKQELWWHEYLENDFKPNKIMICSINFIPLVIHLGYLIHDYFATEIIQFNRIEKTWKWKRLENKVNKKSWYIINKEIQENQNNQRITLLISISSKVKEKDILEIFGNDVNVLKISVENPNRNWLKYKEQLFGFQRIFIKLIDDLINELSELNEIHLFCSIPTPVAFIIGSSINPNMHPRFVLYNYNVKKEPKYSRAFEIN